MEEASLGVMATGLIGLASQHPRSPGDGRPGVRFRILDGTRPEAPEAGFWQRVVEVLPHDVAVGQVREAPEILGELF